MEQNEICRNFYVKVLGIDNDTLLNQLLNLSFVKYIEKKEYLIHLGEKEKYLYFLDEGILRAFMDKNNYQELTDCFFYRKGTPVIAATKVDRVYHSSMIIQALSDCTLIALPISIFHILLKEYSSLKDIYIYWLSDSLQMHMELKYARSLDTVGRCKWFIQKYPDLIGKIQKQYIASFLNMTLSSYGKAMKKIQKNTDEI